MTPKIEFSYLGGGYTLASSPDVPGLYLLGQSHAEIEAKLPTAIARLRELNRDIGREP